MNLETVDGKVTCFSCGQQHSEEFQTDYIDYYENMYKIHKKSVYHRKYHIENVISDLCCEERICITRCQIKKKKKICDVFDQIAKVFNQIDRNRKRLMNTKFILRKLFKMLSLPYKKYQP